MATQRGTATTAVGSAITVTPTEAVGTVEGDLQIVGGVHKSATDVMAMAGASGWAQLGTTNNFSSTTHKVFWRIRPAAAGSLAVTGATNSISVVLVTYQAGTFDPADPFGTLAQPTNAGVIPALDPESTGTSTLLGIIGASNNTASSAYAYNGLTLGAGITELADAGTADGTNSQISAFHLDQTGGGAISAGTFTNANGESFIFEILPAPAGGATVEGAFSLETTFGAATAAKKNANAAFALPLTAGLAVTGKKTANAAFALPVTFTAATAARKNANAAFSLPMTLTIDTAGEVSSSTTGAFSLEISFGATVAAKKIANAAFSLPVAVSVATSAKKDAHGALALPVAFSIATTARKTTYAAFDLPLVLTIATSGALGEPDLLDPIRTGWLATAGVGYLASQVNGRIRQPLTGYSVPGSIT